MDTKPVATTDDVTPKLVRDLLVASFEIASEEGTPISDCETTVTKLKTQNQLGVTVKCGQQAKHFTVLVTER